MKRFKIKEGTHEVLKLEDINKALDCEQIIQLTKLVSFIRGYRKAKGKQPRPKYLVVNCDEPYADRVREVIKQGELSK